MFRLYSPAFSEGGPVPRAHTCDAADLSPPLAWAEIPPETVELALVVDDPDAPNGTWVHWVLYGISPNVTGLSAGIPRDPDLRSPILARQGLNDFRRIGWGGPCPPPGPAHRYVFTLRALNQVTKIPPGASKAVLLEAIRKFVIGEAKLTGKYGRSS